MSAMKERYLQLRNLIAEHDKNYHVNDQPTVSDEVYDSLKREMLAIEFANLLGVEHEKVGHPVEEGVVKHHHATPMLSLTNGYKTSDLEEFVGRVKRLYPIATFAAELKLDGLAVALIYENGELVGAGTRGDKWVGESVLENAQHVQGVPQRLSGSNLPARIEVRGEIVLPKENFERINRELLENGRRTYASPRNAAAGTIRQGDPLLVKERGVVFYPYSVVEGSDAVRQTEMLAQCVRWGFNEPLMIEETSIVDGMLDIIAQVQDKRQMLPIDIDGVVFKVNLIGLRSGMGIIANAPRWALAYKFAPEEATSVLRDVVFQVGRSGVITPVAKIDAVTVGQVTVSSVNLHNIHEIRRLGLRIGDTVVVVRAGDVIPKITSKVHGLTSGESRDIFEPMQCPSCYGRLYVDGAETFCRTVVGCKEQDIARLVHYTSREALNIQGIGPNVAEALYNAKVVRTPSDLYYLDIDKLTSAGIGRADSAFILVNILKSKPTLAKFIFALGIRDVGEVSAAALADYFGSIDAIHKAVIEGLPLEKMKINQVGQVTAASIRIAFTNVAFMTDLAAIFRSGVTVSVPVKAIGRLTGQVWAVTGSFSHWKRPELKELLKAQGAVTVDSVTNAVTHLAAGEKAGTKLTTARERGIPCLDEEAILKLLESFQ